MKIGILGLRLCSPLQKGGNLGCYALSFAFLEVMNRIAEQEKIKVTIIVLQQVGYLGFMKRVVKKLFSRTDAVISYYSNHYSNLSFGYGYYLYKKERYVLLKSVKQCQCVFDFTAGDSFTDLYGKERFFHRTRLKKAIIDCNIPLILGSQTIGPFVDHEVEKFAVEVINKSKYVFIRDNLSKDYVEKISSVRPILTSDIAFFLPYKKQNQSFDKIKIGFNPSGLLWMGGYTNDNQFGLTVDYKSFCKSIIKYLIDSGFEVHLILHAYSINDRTDEYYADNDRLAVDQLHTDYPDTIISPYFSTPMDAKSYISSMNLFIGARMHATIAAISSGVPVIPFSYSRKFEGLFSSLNYPYVIEGTRWDTSKAIDETKKWIGDIGKMQESIIECKKIIEQKNNILLEKYTNAIIALSK